MRNIIIAIVVIIVVIGGIYWWMGGTDNVPEEVTVPAETDNGGDTDQGTAEPETGTTMEETEEETEAQ